MPKLFKGMLIVVALLASAFAVTALDVPQNSMERNPVTHANQPDLIEQIGGSATIEIIPASGEQGSTHQILVNGLNPSQAVSLRIIEDATSTEVFTTTGTADSNGRLQESIFSTREDAPGTYTVTVQTGSGETLASATLTIIERVAQAGDISVAPQDLTTPDTFTITVTGVREFADLTVNVSTPNGLVLVTESVLASVEGEATLDIVLPPDVDATTLTVEAFDRGTELVASGEISVQQAEQAEQQEETPAGPTVSVEPANVMQEETFTINVSGLAAEGDFTLEIVQGMADVPVYTTERVADAQGAFSLTLRTSADDEPGTYIINLSVAGELVSSAELVIMAEGAAAPEATAEPEADAQAVAATLTVTPETAEEGTDFIVTITGLPADAAATLEVLSGDDIVASQPVTADLNGNAIFILEGELAPDVYSATVVLDEAVLATAEFSVTGAADAETMQEETPAPDAPAQAVDRVAVSVEPLNGAQGTEYTVTVSGLDAGDIVELDFTLEGESVFTTSRTVDANGEAIVEIVSSESDPSGVYTVTVLQDGEMIASTDFGIGEGVDVQPPTEAPVTEAPATEAPATEAPATEDAPAEPEGVLLTIDPPVGPNGTEYTFEVTGLQAGEVVTLDLVFNGVSVFNTQRTADAFGTVQLVLVSNPDDEQGIYTMRVLRGDAVIATGDLGVGDVELPETATPQPQATDAPATQAPATEAPATESTLSVMVEPDSGPRGTDHEITVSGLEVGASVTIDILLDAEVVFSTVREADANGVVMLVIQADEADPEGVYIVQVTSEAGDVVEGTFTVGAVQATPAPTQAPPVSDEATVSVEPFSGPIGTSYDISIEGLGNAETIDFEVLFGEEVVFETQLTANSDGTAGITLTSEESDAPGTYTLRVLRDGTVIGQGSFAIADETVTVPDETPVPQAEVVAESFVTEGVLTVDEPQVSIPYTGEAGASVIMTLTSPDFDTYLILLDDQGNELIENDDSAGDLNSRIGPYTLPYSGEYTIVATSFDFETGGPSSTGAFTLTVESANVTTISYGDVTQLSFDAETSLQILSFEATAGDVIFVNINSNGSIDTFASLVDPTGVEVASDDDGGSGLDPEIARYVVTTTGTHQLAVSAFSPGSSGTAMALVDRSDVRTLDTEARVVTLSNKQFSDALTFIGVAGEAIQLNVSLLSGNPENLFVAVTQDGQQLMSYNTVGLPDTITLGFETPLDGPVAITVEDLSGANSTLELTITRQ